MKKERNKERILKNNANIPGNPNKTMTKAGAMEGTAVDTTTAVVTATAVGTTVGTAEDTAEDTTLDTTKEGTTLMASLHLICSSMERLLDNSAK